MSDDSRDDSKTTGGRHQPIRIKVPGFISEEVGLGDVIKTVTSTFGIKPCGGCQKRAETLNNWVSFTPWDRHG
ncbi:MAG: hypothetical protein SFH39_16900 [Candidatus Magnetobacterium sp. LHC-1]|uniref:Uncharacterized protein n=1 Tax=Candidatus Magnetobacterium casense TaxID=1455061 RepID=A0ABS6S121_9BACT|nr:hypothetical protein [Candidatus Magnetobacterium casensis]MBF0608366.1 hypothetical protein [Nitrospirota bacterium]MBV6342098.1 hypothetical protein [Candidatus Magnetobacterium casensis]